MEHNKKKFKYTVAFITIQYLLAFCIIFFFDLKFSEIWEFVKYLAFYFLIFILPTILFIVLSYKQNPIKYLKLNFKKIYVGVIVIFAAALIFFSANGFKLMPQATGKALFMLIISGTLAGVFEETVFRGFYLRAIEEKSGFIMANIIVSALFTAVHFSRIPSSGIIQLPILFVFSLFMGYLYKKTGSVTNAIMAHAVFNILTYLF